MYLYYHKDPKGNFGDDLNPWMWPRIFSGLFSADFHHEESNVNVLGESDKLFLGIGTLLNSGNPDQGCKIIFGSGVGYGKPPSIDSKWEFFFVRGPLTARRLSLDKEAAICDPAILLPDLIRNYNFGRGQDIGYMPHCASIRHGEWNKVCGELGIKLIDPQSDVETVAREIASCSMLITEALHGAIVSDAMRIPWVPVVTSNQVLEFKWLDWCASIGIDYAPKQLVSLWRPESGFVKKIRYGVKLKLAEQQLRSIVRNANPVISKDDVIFILQKKIYGQIDRFRDKYLHGS